MPLLQWKDEYGIGVRSVDYEHRTLIEVINQLDDRLAADAGFDEILDFLGEIHALIEAHFALEEKVMRDARYAAYGAHKADHDRLLEDIRDIMEGVERDAGAPYRAALSDRVGRWFGDHFREFDRRLHATIHPSGRGSLTG